MFSAEHLARALRESAEGASIEMSIEERIKMALRDSEERELAQELCANRERGPTGSGCLSV